MDPFEIPIQTTATGDGVQKTVDGVKQVGQAVRDANGRFVSSGKAAEAGLSEVEGAAKKATSAVDELRDASKEASASGEESTGQLLDKLNQITSAATSADKAEKQFNDQIATANPEALEAIHSELTRIIKEADAAGQSSAALRQHLGTVEGAITAQVAATEASGAATAEAGNDALSAAGNAGSLVQAMQGVSRSAHAAHLIQKAWALFLAGEFVPAARAAAVGARALWEALLGPVGLVIAGIVAVVATIGTLVKRHREAAEKMEADNHTVQEAVDGTRDKLGALAAAKLTSTTQLEDSRKLTDQLTAQADAAARLRAEQDKLQDAGTRLQLAQLNVEKQKALRAAGGDKDKEAAVEVDFTQREVAIRNADVKRRADRDVQNAYAAQDAAQENLGRLRQQRATGQDTLDTYSANNLPRIIDVLRSLGFQPNANAKKGEEYAGDEARLGIQKKDLQDKHKGAGDADYDAIQAQLDLINRYKQAVSDQKEADDARKKLDDLVPQIAAAEAKIKELALQVQTAQANRRAVDVETAGAAEETGKKVDDYKRETTKRTAAKTNEAEQQDLKNQIEALQQANSVLKPNDPTAVKNDATIKALQKRVLDLEDALRALDKPLTPEQTTATALAKSRLDLAATKDTRQNALEGAHTDAEQATQLAQRFAHRDAAGHQDAVSQKIETAARVMRENPSDKAAGDLVTALHPLLDTILLQGKDQAATAERLRALQRDLENVRMQLKNMRTPQQ